MKKWKRIIIIAIVIALLLLAVHIVCGVVWKNQIMSGLALTLPADGRFVYYHHAFWDRWECVIVWDDPLIYDELETQVVGKDLVYAFCPMSSVGEKLLERYSVSKSLILNMEEFAPTAIRKSYGNSGGVLCRTATQTILYMKNPFPYRA